MTFDEIYLASLDPTRAALITNNYPALAQPGSAQYDPTKAKQLLTDALKSGLPIDTQIMLWHWDAEMIMTIRENQGYAYVPSYGQPNINIAPGLSMPGVLTNYQVVPPPGSIKVSTNPSDYPPYQAPTTAPVSTDIVVGPFEMSEVDSQGILRYYYGVVFGESSPVGTTTTFDGDSYTKVRVPNHEPIKDPGTGKMVITYMIMWQLNLN